MKITQANTQQTISNALHKYAELIKPTYGPAGKKVLIATNEFQLKAADDGKAVGDDIELENEFENAVVMYIREATNKTNTRVGDGTSTATILTESIYDNTVGDVKDPFKSKPNYHADVVEIKKATQEAIDYIKGKSKTIETAEELYAVAYNSYNNDKIARLIADTLFKIGQDGVLAIEDSQTAETQIEIVEGIEFEKGYASPYFINTEKGEVVLNSPNFLLVNEKLERWEDLKGVLIVGNQPRFSNIVIVADGFSEQVLGNVIMGKLRGLFTPLLLEIPGFGEQKLENLKDISAVVGATIFDPKTKKLAEFTMTDAGSASKVISKKDRTVVLGGNDESIGVRVLELQNRIQNVNNNFEKERLEKKIASLKGGIALIKVGANTENEQKSIKMKVEDAVNATKVAFKDGVVAGGGKTFAEIETSSEILNKALKAPLAQLEENGKEFMDDNVVDPTGVLVAALETASSIACGLLEMSGIIATKRKEEKD